MFLLNFNAIPYFKLEKNFVLFNDNKPKTYNIIGLLSHKNRFMNCLR